MESQKKVSSISRLIILIGVISILSGLVGCDAVNLNQDPTDSDPKTYVTLDLIGSFESPSYQYMYVVDLSAFSIAKVTNPYDGVDNGTWEIINDGVQKVAINGSSEDYEFTISESNGVILLTDVTDNNRVYTERTAPLPTPYGMLLFYSTTFKEMSISWAAVTGATSYEIYKAISADAGNGTKIGTSTTTSFKDDQTDFVSGTTYYYYVVAVSSAGKSQKSNTASKKI